MSRRLAALLGALACACASAPPRVLAPEAGQAAPLALSEASFDYRIGPLDVLRVNVFAHPELSSALLRDNQPGSPVDGRGQIQLPLVGAVSVQGLTVEEAAAAVAAALHRYLKEPRVDVAVTTFGAHRYLVLGAVKEPGAYVMERPLTLAEALARAGGFDAYALRSQVAWVSGTLAAESVRLFDATAIDPRAAALLAPGDVIFVGRKGWADASDAAKDLLPILQIVTTPVSIALQAATLERVL
jgi:polysaccharide export outer membrane protein